MPVIHRTAVVPYSAGQMFDLVNDVEAYPEFLDWCSESTIIMEGEDELQATMLLSKGGVHKAFTTHNRMQKNKMIEIRLVNGPFKHLEGFWRFESLSQSSSEISFDIEFEFVNFLMGLVMKPIFHPIANTLVDAFCERAIAVYDSGNKD